MPDERQILELLEQMMDSGHTPEQVCVGRPDLLTAVQERWDRVRAVRSQLDLLFPAPGSLSHADIAHRRRTLAGLGESGKLPAIAGYEVEAFLGSGGMGVVYRARHLKLKRVVAIKMLRSGAYASDHELACLLREAQAVAGLRHPNIVQVHDVGELDGLPYFTMELVDGGTLAQKLAGAPQPARDAAELTAVLADAIAAAHQGGIVHRDLKPANILLSADGTPKIADFSLARSLVGESALTLSSARVGTPSYMAPEQVLGKAEAFCPAVDVYALGAVLYEILTGRPPFRSETPAETQRQVITEEPVSPTRLNSRVPRDLETVCLKCLHKDPRRRYASAAAVGDDLRRYLRGEPTAARRAGLAERAIKWARRRPAHATAFIAIVLLAMSLAGGGAWWAAERSRLMRSVGEDLREISLRQTASDWALARTAVERAKVRIGENGNEELRARIMQAERDLDVVARLDRLAVAQTLFVEGPSDKKARNAAVDREYTVIFRDAGLLIGDDDQAAAVAARVMGSDVRDALVSALDSWAACNVEMRMRSRQDWLLEIARRADRNPTGWRERVRDPSAWNNPAMLAELARTVPDSDQSPALLLSLGERLRAQGGDWLPYLRRVQQAHPSDFRVNTKLAMALTKQDLQEAIRYFQAAIAIRPDAAVAHTNLGIALGAAGRLDESADRLSEAIRLDDTLAIAHNGLGNVLLLKRRRGEAIAEFRRSIKLDPDFASPHSNLGKALAEEGKPDEAIAEFRLAIAKDPDFAAALSGLGLLLKMQGRADEAIEVCERALRSDPESLSARINLSVALKAKGRFEDAVVHLEKAVQIAPADTEAHYNLGVTFYETGRLPDAIKHLREALRLKGGQAKTHHALGMAVGEAGDLDAAIAQFRQSLTIEPARLVSAGALGRALMAQGRFFEARPELQRYLDSMPESDKSRTAVANYVKQCDESIALASKLDRTLRGDGQPLDGHECLRFADLCRVMRRYADAARFFSDAFEREPALATDLRSGWRYIAARVAARAGAEEREASDAEPGLDDHTRAGLRKQARDWLLADLAEWDKFRSASGTAAVEPMRSTLKHWRSVADLACIRDAASLDRLSEVERAECRDLWRRVDQMAAQAGDGR